MSDDLLELAIGQRNAALDTLAETERLLMLAIAQRNDADLLDTAIHQRNAATQTAWRTEALLSRAIDQRNCAVSASDQLRSEVYDGRAKVLDLRKSIVDLFGHRMYCNPSDAGLALSTLADSDFNTLGGEIGYLRRNLKPGQTAIDIGANVGLYTLLFARQVGPCGRVVAFEPGPLSFGLLKANVEVNRYRNVTVENMAVTNRKGSVDLFVCLDGESDNRITGAQGNREKRPVACTSIDRYWPRGQSVDYIKIDVQGAEPLVIDGMKRVLTDNPDVRVLLEYSPGAFDNHTAFLSQLTGLGFSLHILPEDAEEWPVTPERLIAQGRDCNTNLVLRRL